MTNRITHTIKQAGVVGAGGAGFPAYVKLETHVGTVIANGSECEPLLASDRYMMIQQATWIMKGLKVAMQATGAKEAIIGVKAHYEQAVAALSAALPQDNSICLHLLENYYPAGDEFLLVYDVTGKVIPEGGLPLDVGVVVCNVTTLMQIAHAMDGKPVTERAVTLAGEFQSPKVVVVPMGTTYKDLINIADGFTRNDVVLIDGGPMMGKIVDDWQAGIAKTTSGVLALPKDHFIVRMMTKTLSQMVKLSKAACCQCFRCTDLCPRNLIGHHLFPHMTMRTIDYNNAEMTDHITSAFLCSQCGVCELIGCDFMLLSPRQIYAAYRKELVKKGIKNPHRRTDCKVSSQFENRKIAIPMLLKKLDLEKYDIDIPFAGKKEVANVRIALNRHVGKPAVAMVRPGQTVRAGDVIAATPEDQLGTVYHASIDGTVVDVAVDRVEITK
ncbi:MAG: 4Fe-4S dicluster domain-containing protein [Pseudomonadota bacterium]